MKTFEQIKNEAINKARRGGGCAVGEYRFAGIWWNCDSVQDVCRALRNDDRHPYDYNAFNKYSTADEALAYAKDSEGSEEIFRQVVNRAIEAGDYQAFSLDIQDVQPVATAELEVNDDDIRNALAEEEREFVDVVVTCRVAVNGGYDNVLFLETTIDLERE